MSESTEEIEKRGKHLINVSRLALQWIPIYILLFFCLLSIIVILVFFADASFFGSAVTHSRVVIGFPVCVTLSLGIVVGFEIRSGQFKIEFSSVKLAGPIIPTLLWIAIFLSMVTGLKLLW